MIGKVNYGRVPMFTAEPQPLPLNTETEKYRDYIRPAIIADKGQYDRLLKIMPVYKIRRKVKGLTRESAREALERLLGSGNNPKEIESEVADKINLKLGRNNLLFKLVSSKGWCQLWEIDPE
jgi:hypothetical protein